MGRSLRPPQGEAGKKGSLLRSGGALTSPTSGLPVRQAGTFSVIEINI